MSEEFTVHAKRPEPLYRIDEECTTGWVEVKTNLTKNECEIERASLINDGVSPDRIKIVRIR